MFANRFAFFTTFCACLLSIATVATAMTGPMTPEELEEAADLIITGVVSDAECLGVTDTDPPQHLYESTIQVGTWTPGDAMDSILVQFSVTDWGDGAFPPSCFWEPKFLEGEKGKWHLASQTEEGIGTTYSLIHWSAFTPDLDSDPLPLDICSQSSEEEGGEDPTEEAGDPCECLLDEDCGDGYVCDGCGCIESTEEGGAEPAEEGGEEPTEEGGEEPTEEGGEEPTEEGGEEATEEEGGEEPTEEGGEEPTEEGGEEPTEEGGEEATEEEGGEATEEEGGEATEEEGGEATEEEGGEATEEEGGEEEEGGDDDDDGGCAQLPSSGLPLIPFVLGMLFLIARVRRRQITL